MATGATERFYDAFSTQFVRDYVHGNRRVDRQLAFLRAAVPESSDRALVIGCGSGESARLVARTAPRCQVVAVDLSGENLRLARRLHPHPRVTYRKLDVLADDIDERFDVIVLPDVYEHIPVDKRSILHQRLDRALTADGRLLITVPSPSKQAALAASGRGLQIVDEVVTPADLEELSRDVHGELIYIALISVWDADDYIHAAIGRGGSRTAAIVLPDSHRRIGDQPGRLRHLAGAAFRSMYVRIRLRGGDTARQDHDGRE